MQTFTRDDLRELLADRPEPCLSLYLPTGPGVGEQTPIRWRNCLARAETALVERGMRPAEAVEFLDGARKMLVARPRMPEQGRGLAYFLAPEFQRLHLLPWTFEERVVVGERFLVTPLLPLLGDGIFHVLALSQNGVRLLRCSRDEFAAVELPGVPANIDEALATHDVDEPLNLHTRPMGAGKWAGIFHGHGVGIDDVKDDLLRYFRMVARGLRPVLGGDRSPLVLASVAYLQPIFRQACDQAGLLPDGLEGSPDRLSDRELHQMAWALVEPVFRRHREDRLALYRQFNGTGRTDSRLETLLPAACRGEIETLFVASDRQAWGKFDPASGAIQRHDKPGCSDEDLLNLTACQILRHGGTVHSLPVAQMPEGALLAGIHWLPRDRHH